MRGPGTRRHAESLLPLLLYAAAAAAPIASCVSLGNGLHLEASVPPLPTDRLALVAAELAELVYPSTVGASCRGDCAAEREQWEANVTEVATSMGDAGWAEAYSSLGLQGRTLRFVNGLDVVPLVPPPPSSARCGPVALPGPAVSDVGRTGWSFALQHGRHLRFSCTCWLSTLLRLPLLRLPQVGRLCARRKRCVHSGW